MHNELYSTLAGKATQSEPQLAGPRKAAVSIILDSRDLPRTLLIKRAERSGDPWSGQIAFPGGKFQEGDRTARDTAARETLEEVGIDLGTNADFLGYFQPFRTHTGVMDVVPALFLLRSPVTVRINEEVTSYRWVDLKKLVSDESKVSYRLNFGGEPREVPAYRVEDYMIWGLTHRIISDLVA